MDDEHLPEAIEIEITDTLDLHSFRPQEVEEVVQSFLEAAMEAGFDHLRIIHGKGIGSQRRMIRSLLARHPNVGSFADAPADAGGWGATTVILKTDTVSDPNG